MNNILKQYFSKVLDPEKPVLSETTVCCTKCHRHGMVKRFDATNESIQSDHLFEFHAIICNQPPDYILGAELLDTSQNPEEDSVIGQIQYTEEDVVEVEFVQQGTEGEEVIQQDTEQNRETPIVRHSGVWNYFEEHPSDQKVYCLICRQNNLIHSYSSNSSTSNLRKHLRTAHEVEVENYRPLHKKGKTEERRGFGISRVWKYFCKVKKNGEIQEKDFVYCAECLKTGVQHRYKQTSSTGTLKAHLRSIHQLDIHSGREYNDNTNVTDLDPFETIVGVEASPVKSHRKGKTKKLSSARSYYQDVEDDEEYVQCTLCFDENKVHKYRKSTSSSTLKAHIVQKHEIDPDVEEAEKAKNVVDVGEILDTNTEALFTFEQEILDKAQKITSIKTRKIRTYFFRLDDEENFCCTFCILDGIKKQYKPTTSTSGLRRHLISAHELDPLGYFKTENPSEITLNEEQLAESIAVTNKAKESEVWKYFCRKEIENDDMTLTLDEDYIYCSLCWDAPIRQIHKYKNTTSSGALKRHLAARHGTIIENRRHKASTLKGEDLEEEGFEDQNEISMEGLEIVSPKVLSVPQVFVPKPPPLQLVPKVPKHCRSCGKKDAGFFTKLSAVFDDADPNESEQPEQISLSELYFQVTGIQVKSDDGMSQLICYLCEANLKSAYKFRKIALETETEMLRKLYVESNDMEDYEVLDEEYLEVEPTVTPPPNIKLEFLASDTETTYPQLPQKKSREKMKTFTLIANHKVKPEINRIKRTQDRLVMRQDDLEENGSEIDEYDLHGRKDVAFQEFDIIEDETEQIAAKRKKVDMNFDEMVWSDMKRFITGKKHKMSERSKLKYTQQ